MMAGSPRPGVGEDDDLLALLDRLGAGNFILVGHSMGAVIALRAAIKRPHGIAGIVAYGPYCQFHRSLIGRLNVAGLPARPITDLALVAHRILGVRPISVNPPDLQRLRIPVLVIHGSDDQVAPIDHGCRIAAALPNATLIEIPDARHTDSHSIDAKRHDQSVREFISRIAIEQPQPV